MEVYLDKPDESIKKIFAATFPGYTGRTFKVSTLIPLFLESYWSGGSKTTYAFYCLDTGKATGVETNHPFFEPGKPSKLDKLPLRMVIVGHSYFRGKDMGLTIYANKEDITPMIPEKPDLTPDERTVLTFTASRKSSYAGIKNYRFHCATEKTGITKARWELAKLSLIASKLLNKAGAITSKGRNAI